MEYAIMALLAVAGALRLWQQARTVSRLKSRLAGAEGRWSKERQELQSRLEALEQRREEEPDPVRAAERNERLFQQGLNNILTYEAGRRTDR